MFDSERSATRQPRRLTRTALLRLIASLVLAAIALVPSIARAHDRLDQRTPAERHSRFRWTNSCESVPHKATATGAIAPAAAWLSASAPTALEPPARAHAPVVSADTKPPVLPFVRTASPLRAPPAPRS